MKQISLVEIHNCVVGNTIKSDHRMETREGKLTIVFNDRSSIVVDKEFSQFIALDKYRENPISMHSNQVGKIKNNKDG